MLTIIVLIIVNLLKIVILFFKQNICLIFVHEYIWKKKS